MTEQATRAKAALLNGLVADAATMPLHWLYSAEKIEAVMGDKAAKPEFFPTPSCPYYSPTEFPNHYTLGQPSPYGEELLCLLDHMVKNKGSFTSPESFADDLLVWGETFGGRPNSCTKKFIEQRKAGAKFPECGADDNQANSLIKAMVITARYYGKEELMDKVDEAVRVHQENDLAALYAMASARFLERIIQGESIAVVLAKDEEGMDIDVLKAHKFVHENKSKPTWQFIEALGEFLKLQPVYATSCVLPGAYVLSIYLLATRTGDDVLRENIRIGGDNCSRSVFLGAVLGAAAGKVSSEWSAKVKDFADYSSKVDVLVNART